MTDDSGQGLPALPLPPASLRAAVRGGRLCVFDILRRRFVTLTPEEWVRQRFVRWLIERKGYPQALLANEVTLALPGLRLRCDTVLYDARAKPRLIAEYKAPEVNIGQGTFDQLARYNTALHADWLVVSNGLEHYCLRMDYAAGSCRFLSAIPSYGEL